MIKPKTGLRWLITAYTVIALGFFFYSYTQTDLSLTLSQAGIWQSLQKIFQYVGYYQRPWSTAVYIILISGYFILYAIAFRLAKSNRLPLKTLWLIITVVVFFSVFSYPAFSYDIFNYMFSAKTVLLYHKNPYLVTPLQFIGIEPWLSFMRWTHLPSAYSPVWIGMTMVPYLFGLGYFIIFLFNLKIMLAFFYLVTVWAISHIMKLTDNKNQIAGTVLFALNPLVIIESLVSPHNDIVMMAFAMLAMYLYLTKKTLISWIFLAFSVAVKMMTVLLYPVALVGWKKKPAVVVMTGAMLIGFLKKELLPWYFIWFIPFVAFLPGSTNMIALSSGLSLGLILRYAPILYYGDYGAPAIRVREYVTYIPLAISMIWVVCRSLQVRFIRH